MLNSDAYKTYDNYRCDDHEEINMFGTYVRTPRNLTLTKTINISSTSLHAC